MPVQTAAHAFVLNGQPIHCIEFGHGHINSTFRITTDTGHEYILQRINRYVFRHPVQLMANARSVTEHIRQRVEDPRMTLHFLPTHEGLYYHRDDQGEFWRMYDFLGGFCLDAPESAKDFYQSALAFGRFQQLLADFPADTLFETIPHFHNTVHRYGQLKQSMESDPLGRLQGVRQEAAFLLEREERGCALQRMLERGELPLRVTHNDTKLNNVLLDRHTRKSLCVLDLDTVMPGLSVHDFGDSIRFGAATAAEDEPDPSKMHLDLTLYEAYTRGYLEAASSLTEAEIQTLPLGAYVMTLEVAGRFLKDYLDGDLYFKTAYPEHNLVRARSQIALVADMEQKWDEMNQIVAKTAAKTILH